MAHFPPMVAVSITHVENISVLAELFPWFFLSFSIHKTELLNAAIFLCVCALRGRIGYKCSEMLENVYVHLHRNPIFDLQRRK